MELEKPKVRGNLPKSPVCKATHFADFKPEYLFNQKSMVKTSADR